MYITHNHNSATGTRTRVARVRAEYPNQLDYRGIRAHLNFNSNLRRKTLDFLCDFLFLFVWTLIVPSWSVGKLKKAEKLFQLFQLLEGTPSY